MDKRYYIGCLDGLGNLCVRAEFDMRKLARTCLVRLSRCYDNLVWIMVDQGGDVLDVRIAGEEHSQQSVLIDTDDIESYDIPEWQDGYVYPYVRYTLVE